MSVQRLPVEYCFPQTLSPEGLDVFLASGWFRSGGMLYRSRIVCLGAELYSVINIRLRVSSYQPSKRHRRLLRKNQPLFRVEVGPAYISSRKEELYRAHRHRFKGFVFDELRELLSLEEGIFNTWEVAVYDGDQLVAVSFFDIGREGIASLLAIYDQNYSKYSLGIFTMLCEVDFAQRNGIDFFYPGYVLHKSSEFDYKLQLGRLEYRGTDDQWYTFDHEPAIKYPSAELQQRIQDAEKELSNVGLTSYQLLYPFFSVGYLDFLEESFVKSPLFIRINEANSRSEEVILEYLLEDNEYVLSQVTPCDLYDDMVKPQVGMECQTNDRMWQQDLLTYDVTLCKSKSLQEVIWRARDILQRERIWDQSV
ncbi:MAG: hypothetical protein AAGI38_15035 [Bacteroidota bacterium]